MNILIPQNTLLLSSNIAEDDAAVFTNRNYVAGEKVVYDKAVYERTVGSTTFDAFSTTKIYALNDYVTYSAVNYICTNPTSNPTPLVDTSRWASVVPTTWLVNHAYSVGDTVTFTAYGSTESYVCAVAHTSIATLPSTWIANHAYTAGTIVEYQGNFYSIGYPITSNSSYPPGAIYFFYNPYTKVSITTPAPSATSSYWTKVSSSSWNETSFYKTNDAVNYSGTIYKATADIVSSIPTVDTTRWTAISSKAPSLDTQSWKRLYTTNKWKMFDQFLNSYSQNLDSIEVLISAFGANTIYLGNITAQSVSIEIIDAISDIIIESKVIDLVRQPLDWKDYFYGDWVYNTGTYVVYERTSLTSDVNIRITIANTGYVSVGTLLIGKTSDIGDTKFDFNASALDFSTVVTDTATGETYLSKGNYVNLLSADVFVPTSNADTVYKVITKIQGTPVLFYDLYETTTVYGFIRKFEQVYKSPVETLLNLDIQGLI